MRSIYSFIYSFFIYNMAQILKYSGGGTSPKPIKIGSKYYTKEQLMTDLYGDKLDEYIKFREFNSKEAANFRKNLDNQVNALIDGRLTLNGNTLIDSKGEWSNTGEYAKPKLFGKLNEEQIKNNESLDVANYLIRALNSNKIATYTAPSEYNLFESDAFKTYNDMLEDTDWHNEDVTKRRNLIAKSLEDEANKLANDSNYQSKYSYEGWQDVDWDTRANATIQKLRDAAKILGDSTINGLDLKLKLGQLGYGDLANYLEKEEKIETPQDKQVKQENPEGQKNPEGTQDKKSQKVSAGWEERNAFNFSAPVFIYNGKRYVYRSPEYKKLVAQNPKVTLPDGTVTTISSIIKKAEKDAKQIDRTQTTFYTPVPAGYNYFNNVTESFAGTQDLHSAYLLRQDALSPEGSILRLIFNSNKQNTGPKTVDLFFDPENVKFYEVAYDSNKTPIRGKEMNITNGFNFKQNAPITQIIKPTGNNDIIFNGIADLHPEQLYKQFSDYIKTHQDEINSKTGNSKLKGMYLGSINRILEEVNRGKLSNISGIMRNSGDKQIFIRTADNKLVVIHLNRPLENKQPITYDTLEKIEVKKEGGKIVKAQAGVKVDVQEEPSQEIPQVYSTEQPKTYKTPKTPAGRSMPISRKEQRLQEAVNGEFSAHDSARLALSLIDLGSAIFGVLPGTSALSTATGVASSLGTAVADYTDDKVGFWNATGNLVMNLGLDAASLFPGLKSLKVGKALKFIGNVLPRAIGAFWGYGLIKDENQKNLLLSTGKKIAEGDFGKLTTQDFENITTLIRMATLGARDVASVRNRKPGNVVITGKVGDTKVKTTVKGDDVKGTLGRRMKGLNPRFRSKAKQKLVEDVNKSSVDAKGNSMGWKPDDITDFKTEVIPVEAEYKPKAFMENILGLGNKGFNWVGSDKWFATHFPKYHRGMVTDADVVRMRDTYTDSKYAELNNYFPEYSNREIRDLMNNGRYDTELRNKKAAERRKLIDSGSIEVSKVTDFDINRLTNDVINDEGVKVPDNIEDLVKQAKTFATVGGYFDKNSFETKLLELIRGYKQGGRIERGLSLINAYKSGGLVIPKFKEGSQTTAPTTTVTPYNYISNNFLFDPENYYTTPTKYNTTTFTDADLNKVFIPKGTNSQAGQKAGLTGTPTVPEAIKYSRGIEKLKDYVKKGTFKDDITKYLETNSVRDYNNTISELRRLRSQFEHNRYNTKGDEVQKYNELFNAIFGNYRHSASKLYDTYAEATADRHVLSFANLYDQIGNRIFTKDGKTYWLDNAGYLREGEYGKPKVIKPEQAVEDSQNVLVNGAKTETDAGAGSGGGTGSTQYASNQFKTKTRPNPIQLLRMAELAGALGTNAAATNELLKYRSYGQNPFWRQASLSDKYPLIATTQNQNGSFYTQLKNPTTADLGSYLASLQAGYSKGFTAMQNAYNENYNAFLTSKAGVQEAANYNNAAEVEAGNNNVARAVTAENMKDKVRADLYSTNFAQGIKPFLSETRQYMQDAEKLKQRAAYDVQSAIAKQKYDNDIAAINENYVSSIDKDFLKANEGKSDAAIIQAWLTAHPDKTKEYKALLETPTMDYYKSQAKLYEILAPNIGFLNNTTLAYNYESGGKLTAKDKMKIQKVKDYNAARRQDSKESLKSITKDKEEFGKNYRAMSAGTLKMLERTLK